MMNTKINDNSQIVIYTSPNGNTKIQVHLEDDTVWLTQEQIGNLYEKAKSTISEHIKHIFEEKELDKNATVRNFRIVQKEGNREVNRDIEFYNLDIIIAVGYRVKSPQGTKFRQWATQRIHEYIVKGFTLDDDRLKQEGGRSRYFEELLQRIRDIRSSERNLYQKVTDIYSTSIDYNADNEMTKQFFATVQNKMHYAVHGKTASEIINERADSDKPFMGLTNFEGKYITQRDIGIAKNYLTEEELKQLNLLVSIFLDFAELQATNGRLMKMKDWITKLEEFLSVSEKKILNNAGIISHEKAIKKAQDEYDKYRKEENTKYISDFDREVKIILNKKYK